MLLGRDELTILRGSKFYGTWQWVNSVTGEPEDFAGLSAIVKIKNIHEEFSGQKNTYEVGVATVEPLDVDENAFKGRVDIELSKEDTLHFLIPQEEEDKYGESDFYAILEILLSTGEVILQAKVKVVESLESETLNFLLDERDEAIAINGKLDNILLRNNEYITTRDNLIDVVIPTAIDTYNEKLELYNLNHIDKLETYNLNHIDKLETYNLNHIDKLETYNEKLELYNLNHIDKLETYNLNHDEKVQTLEDIATIVGQDKNIVGQDKLDIETMKQNAKDSEDVATQKALEASQSADSVSEDRIVVEQLESSVQNLALQVTNDKQAVSLDKQTVLNAKIDVETIRDSLQASVNDIANKVNISDVQDLLNSTDPTKPLSANQGRILKGFIDNINTVLNSDDTTLDELQEIVNFIKQNKSILDTLGISNIAGLQSALNAKADKAEVYTKTILDLKISTKQFDKPSAGPLFIKVSPSSIKIPAGLKLTVGTESFKVITDYTLTLASNLVGSTKTAGTDYFVYAKSDATFYISADDTITSDRLIGGFHYGLVGETETVTGNKTEAMMVEQRGIWSHSCWDLKFRPSANVRAKNFAHGIWTDIYVADEDIAIRGYSSPWKSAGVKAKIAGGTTDYGRAIPKIPLAFGGNGTLTYGKFTWFQAAEIAASLKCFLLDYGKFPSLAYGVLEGVSSSTNGYETTVGAIEHYPNLTSRYLEQAVGVQYIWGADLANYPTDATWAWKANTDSRGQIYAMENSPTAVLLGGGRSDGVSAGSRSSLWYDYVWYSGWLVGCRYACDHLELV